MQKEFFGYDSLQNVQEILDEYDVKKFFLVTGKKAYTLSGAEKKIRPFLKDKIVMIFNDFSPNPHMDEVVKGIEQYNKINPDMVIAVGGGSVLDMGKMINLLANNSGNPLDYVKRLKKYTTQGKPFVAIPTTSGTGSESTHFATVYIDKTKYSLADKRLLLPTVSIVDPALTESMTRYLTASTGLDALCQGIESLWAVDSTGESRMYAKEAVTIAVHTIENVVNNPDKTSRLNMAKAAHLSGKAINISKTTACHSISYPITSYFGISHGHAVALTMGQLIEFNSNMSEKDCGDKRGENFVKARVNEIIGLLAAKGAIGAKQNFQTLMKKVGVESRLSRLNIDYNGSRLIVDNGFTPDRMSNNPRVLMKDDLEKIMDEIL
jgi:alcohol dehydrogenase class IV